MMNPYISFIIPSYNAQKTIKKCIDSINNQNYPVDNFEIIAVDNNSTDKTAEIIKSLSRVIYTNEPTQGRSHARNHGARIAKGDLLAFIDADVFLDPDWLVNLVKSFNKDSIGGGQGRIIPSNEDGQASLNKFRIRQQNDSTNNTNIILRLMYYESPMVNSAACMYRKEAFIFVGGFDVLLERHEDIDLAKRVCLAGFDLVAAKESIAHVEYHGEGWWSYFVRSYSEGYTKQSYNAKWLQYFSSLPKDIEVTSPMIKTHESETKRDYTSLKNNIRMFVDEICFNILRGFISFDFHYFLKAINSSFKSAGRVHGILKNGYAGKFEAKVRQDLLDRSIVLKNNYEIKIDKNMRFVIQDNEILYALNIEKNDFVNFDSFPLFKELLNQRSIPQINQ